MKLDHPPTLPYSLAEAELWAHAEDVEYKTSNRRYRIFHCTTHDILFIDPVPDGDLAEIYPHSYYSFTEARTSYVQRAKAILDRRHLRTLLREIPGRELALLDVGGGAGRTLSDARSADPRVVRTQVVDIDPTTAREASTRGHAYFCGRIEDFDTDDRYDLILLLNVIEHVADPLRVLAKLRHWLSPRGRILVKTPNWDSLDARIFRQRNWAGFHCPRHWVLFTKESFADLAKLAELRVARFHYTQGASFWTASTLTWLASRRLVRVDADRPVIRHPLFGPLSAVFAAFDFARSPFSKTSQMFFVLEVDE